MKYLLQPEVGYRIGVSPNGRQTVLGVLLPNIVMCHFDPEGVFLERQTIPLELPPPRSEQRYLYDRQSEAATERQMDAIERHLELTPQPVSVQAFYDGDAHIGISDLPSEYELYLEDPESIEQEFHADFDEAIERWRREGSFVFIWCVEQWVSRDGYIFHTD